MSEKLTTRQRRFAEAYDGNGTEAARKAGYTGSSGTLAVTAHHLLRNPKVREAIDVREEGVLKRLTLNVAELQELWSATALDPTVEAGVRLAAARDLAKSQGAFVQRHEHAIGKSLEELLREGMEPKK